MRLLLALGLAVGLGAPARAASYGVLLLAHGGNERWNATVADIRSALDKDAPTELSLGMGEAASLQRGVDVLQKRGAAKIVVVPLFVHSDSEVLDETRYVLGLRAQPSRVFRERMAQMMAHGSVPGHHAMAPSEARVKALVPLVMAPALDDSPEVTDIVLRRAQGLSRRPGSETLILVAHGPVDDAANEAWLSAMRAHAARVKAKAGFKEALALTIRDDSEAAIKEPALKALRDAVRRAKSEGGRAVVVPYLIARGGIEDHVTQALRGLDFAWDGRTLAPDPNLVAWARRAVSSAAARP